MLERDQWAKTKYVIFNLTHRNRNFLLLLFFFNFDFQTYPALTLEVAGDLRRASITFENPELSMLLFYDSPRRTPVYCLFPPFLSFLECLAHTSQHPRFQPGGPKVRKQQACKTGINTIFLMSSIFTPQHHLSITDIDAHVFLHSPANRHI